MRHTPQALKNNFETKSLQNIIHHNCGTPASVVAQRCEEWRVLKSRNYQRLKKELTTKEHKKDAGAPLTKKPKKNFFIKKF